jgi:hypothetical protein
MVPILHFKKQITKFIPHFHLEEVDRVRASKTLQITIIQSIFDAAVCEKESEKKYTYLTRLPTSHITNSKVQDILETLVITWELYTNK